MNFLKALLLGIVQGLTEFFPVSSSFHLHLAQSLCHVKEVGVLFDLMCHLGTTFALIFYLRKDLFSIDFKQMFLALIPLPFFYFLLHSSISHKTSALFLILTGAILFLGQKFQLKKQSSSKDYLFVGVAQACALFPGLSRSAMTISTARFLGWEAKKAVRFSFLLSIPTILGGSLLKTFQAIDSPSTPLSLCVVGFFASGITGLAVIRFALHYLEKGHYKPLIWYCILIGIISYLLV